MFRSTIDVTDFNRELRSAQDIYSGDEYFTVKSRHARNMARGSGVTFSVQSLVLLLKLRAKLIQVGPPSHFTLRPVATKQQENSSAPLNMKHWATYR